MNQLSPKRITMASLAVTCCLLMAFSPLTTFAQVTPEVTQRMTVRRQAQMHTLALTGGGGMINLVNVDYNPNRNFINIGCIMGPPPTYTPAFITFRGQSMHTASDIKSAKYVAANYPDQNPNFTTDKYKYCTIKREMGYPARQTFAGSSFIFYIAVKPGLRTILGTGPTSFTSSKFVGCGTNFHSFSNDTTNTEYYRIFDNERVPVKVIEITAKVMTAMASNPDESKILIAYDQVVDVFEIQGKTSFKMNTLTQAVIGTNSDIFGMQYIQDQKNYPEQYVFLRTGSTGNQAQFLVVNIRPLSGQVLKRAETGSSLTTSLTVLRPELANIVGTSWTAAAVLQTSNGRALFYNHKTNRIAIQVFTGNYGVTSIVPIDDTVVYTGENNQADRINFFRYPDEVLCDDFCLSCTNSGIDSQNIQMFKYTCQRCVPGYRLIGTKCSKCPSADLGFLGGICTNCLARGMAIEDGVCKRCPKNSIVNSRTKACETCPLGTIAFRRECKACPANSIIVKGECKVCEAGKIAKDGACIECPSGSFKKANESVCTKCGPLQVVSAAKDKCEDCPPNQLRINGECSFCPASTHLSNSICLPCPNNGIRLRLEDSRCAINPCAVGQGYANGGCRECKADEFSRDGECLTCPNKKLQIVTNNQCKNIWDSSKNRVSEQNLTPYTIYLRQGTRMAYLIFSKEILKFDRRSLITSVTSKSTFQTEIGIKRLTVVGNTARIQLPFTLRQPQGLSLRYRYSSRRPTFVSLDTKSKINSFNQIVAPTNGATSSDISLEPRVSENEPKNTAKEFYLIDKNGFTGSEELTRPFIIGYIVIAKGDDRNLPDDYFRARGARVSFKDSKLLVKLDLSFLENSGKHTLLFFPVWYSQLGSEEASILKEFPAQELEIEV